MGSCQGRSSVEVAYFPLEESPSISDDAEEEEEKTEDYVDGERRRRETQDWEMFGGPMFYFRYEVGTREGR